MKLFIWKGVFSDYTSGIAFAMAKNVREARKVLYLKALRGAAPGMGPHEVIAMEREIGRKPDVVSKVTEGDYVCGGG